MAAVDNRGHRPNGEGNLMGSVETTPLVKEEMGCPAIIEPKISHAVLLTSAQLSRGLVHCFSSYSLWHVSSARGLSSQWDCVKGHTCRRFDVAAAPDGSRLREHRSKLLHT